MVRLVQLLESAAEAPFLVPLITRQIIYQPWIGEQHDQLRHTAALRGYVPQLARAITHLHQEFDQQRRIGSIAQAWHVRLGISSPLQRCHGHEPCAVPKGLRVQKARRLMLGERLDATSAAYHVRYHNSSHFRREYDSLFGLAPMRDMERLRGTTWKASAWQLIQ